LNQDEFAFADLANARGFVLVAVGNPIAFIDDFTHTFGKVVGGTTPLAVSVEGVFFAVVDGELGTGVVL
jgi:hypothetical protein